MRVGSSSFRAIVERQREWSLRTFGEGNRTEGLLNHILKEVAEVRDSGGDLEEWIDLIILAMDGAWRCGHSPERIAAALEAKQAKNATRKWPPIGSVPADQPVEHIRDDYERLGATNETS